MVAPPVVFPVDPIPSIKNTGADWIAFIPYAFSSKNKPEVIFRTLIGNGGVSAEEGIRESIRLAKLQHLK